MFKKIILSFLFILFITAPLYANNNVAYNLSNGYVAVREDVFNELVKNDKLIENYKEEIEYLKQSIKEVKELNEQRNSIQNDRITVLKETISFKDQIITYKDENMKNWEKLYNNESKKVDKLRFKNFFQKILIAGLTTYAISQAEDNTAKAIIGGIGSSIILIEW